MDLYKVLGVKDSASKEEITKAYYKHAKEKHPDKNPSANAKEEFHAIEEAYRVLQDEKKRENYDRFDLPKARTANRRSHSQNQSQHHAGRRNRYGDEFFTGSSESCKADQHYKSTVDEIQRINSELLDRFNAKRRRRHAPSDTSRHSGGSKKFMPDKTDDEYEKIVLSRLRALGRQ